MATFINQTTADLEVQVDGIRIPAPVGVPFQVLDEFADQLRFQDIFKEELAAKKVAPEPAFAAEQGDI